MAASGVDHPPLSPQRTGWAGKDHDRVIPLELALESDETVFPQKKEPLNRRDACTMTVEMKPHKGV